MVCNKWSIYNSFTGNIALPNVQPGTDTIATINGIYVWINPSHRAEVRAVTESIATNNEVLSWADKTYPLQASAGADQQTSQLLQHMQHKLQYLLLKQKSIAEWMVCFFLLIILSSHLYSQHKSQHVLN